MFRYEVFFLSSYLNNIVLFGGASPFLSGVIVRLLLFVLQFTQTDTVITQEIPRQPLQVLCPGLKDCDFSLSRTSISIRLTSPVILPIFSFLIQPGLRD